MADGAPFGDKEGPGIPKLLEVLRQIKKIAIELNAQEVEGRGTLPNHGQQISRNARGGGGGRVQPVHLVDHGGDVIDRVVHRRVLIVVVQLITDDPGEQRRMILIARNRGTRFFELSRHGFRIAVVKAVALPRDIQAKGDR